MKLRIRGDSLRFRLTQTEVASLHEQGWWQDAVILGPLGSPRLDYRVESIPEGPATVTFISGDVTIVTAVMPVAQIAAWAAGNEVGIYFDTPWGTKVAVEKDFRCLDETREEDESDNFANPNAGLAHGNCGTDCGTA
ncbi:MAG: hypothetical protein JWO94_2164 [Verrucomicrobiaceae bacterium]|nr:hypothetical protein [Verrucomicrobiaceae bacterium]